MCLGSPYFCTKICEAPLKKWQANFITISCLAERGRKSGIVQS